MFTFEPLRTTRYQAHAKKVLPQVKCPTQPIIKSHNESTQDSQHFIYDTYFIVNKNQT